MTSFNQTRSKWINKAIQHELKLEDIIAKSAFQMRTEGTDLETVDRYAEALTSGGTLPPIFVSANNDTYEMLDGFHRLEAARKANKDTIAALVFSDLSEQDRATFRLTSNLEHGKSATNKDRRGSCSKLINLSFDDFVSDYKFDIDGFAKHFGIGATMVKEESAYKRANLKRDRDIQAVVLKAKGESAQSIGEQLGVSRKTVGEILKAAQTKEELVAGLKDLLVSFRQSCHSVIEFQNKLLETMELPTHNGEDNKTYSIGFGLGYNWNWEDKDNLFTLSKDVAELLNVKDTEDFPDYATADAENETKAAFLFDRAMKRCPEWTQADEVFKRINAFHVKHLAFPMTMTLTDGTAFDSNSIAIGHVSAYLNNDFYKVTYNFWRKKIAGEGQLWKTNEIITSNHTLSAIRKLWELTEV